MHVYLFQFKVVTRQTDFLYYKYLSFEASYNVQ